MRMYKKVGKGKQAISSGDVYRLPYIRGFPSKIGDFGVQQTVESTPGVFTFGMNNYGYLTYLKCPITSSTPDFIVRYRPSIYSQVGWSDSAGGYVGGVNWVYYPPRITEIGVYVDVVVQPALGIANVAGNVFNIKFYGGITYLAFIIQHNGNAVDLNTESFNAAFPPY